MNDYYTSLRSAQYQQSLGKCQLKLLIHLTPVIIAISRNHVTTNMGGGGVKGILITAAGMLSGLATMEISVKSQEWILI